MFEIIHKFINKMLDKSFYELKGRFGVLTVTLLVTSSPVFSAIDFKDIKKSALVSAISYSSPELMNKRLHEIEISLVHHATLPYSELSYFLARSSSGLQYLSFRGTSNLENALVDLDLSLKLDTDLNIQLHQGFSTAAKAAYNDVKSKLDKSQPIRTTGHSLGGAIALIIAMYLERDGYQLEQVVTFGQPKVTNVKGAGVFNALPVSRVVTVKDIVPLVPPLSPLQLKNLDIYWHLGTEIILLAGKDYAITEGYKSMMRATKFVSNIPDETNINAHKMGTYLTLINQKLVGAQQVPYKMNLNLFGFSLD